MTAARTISFLGLPRTGKSTYLGALWMIIQDPRSPEIREVDVSGDRSYLVRLGEQVAMLEVVARTDVDSDEGLRVTVELPAQGRLDLRIPDLSGETLRLLVEDRTWHELLRHAVDDSDALMLFVHPERLSVPVRTAVTDRLVSELAPGGGTVATGDGVGDADGSANGFAPRLAATAATLIDAIENVLAARSRSQRLKVALMVSAWDVVAATWPAARGAATPLAWAEERLPAVWQVLQANADRLDIALFGVSAIGGRLPEDREKLEVKGSVLDRAYAVAADGTTVPFVAPLSWALA